MSQYEYMTAYDPRKSVVGIMALDGGNPTAIVTGLRVIDSVSITLESSAAPGVGTSSLTYAISGGTVNVYAWKVTGAADTTLIASTGTENFSFHIVGRE